jgi:hypothetical protein
MPLSTTSRSMNRVARSARFRPNICLRVPTPTPSPEPGFRQVLESRGVEL